MTEINNKLRKWVKIDEEIKNLQKKINKLKDKKSTLNPDITNFVISNKNKIKINSNYNLSLKNKVNYSTISKKYITETLLKEKLNQETVDNIVDMIYNNREKTIINYLEIIKN